jgi:hypothetical protein
MNEKQTVRIRRQWNDWQIGEIDFDKLANLHWDILSGGVQAPAPQYFIHGCCWCTDIVGEIAHSCVHGDAPHWIKVCVVKKDNEPEVFKRLLEIVGPKPSKR